MQYIYDIKFRMLQVRENEISLRKWSDGNPHLRTVKGTLVGMTWHSTVNLSFQTNRIPMLLVVTNHLGPDLHLQKNAF